MTFVVMGLGTVFNALTNRRDPDQRAPPPMLKALGIALVPMGDRPATELPRLQTALLTTSLTGMQWLACFGLARCSRWSSRPASGSAAAAPTSAAPDVHPADAPEPRAPDEHSTQQAGTRHSHDEADRDEPDRRVPCETPPAKMKRKEYERELRRLHGELVAMQEWVKASGAKVCIVFEGRDTAGKGGTIKPSPSG